MDNRGSCNCFNNKITGQRKERAVIRFINNLILLILGGVLCVKVGVNLLLH